MAEGCQWVGMEGGEGMGGVQGAGRRRGLSRRCWVGWRGALVISERDFVVMRAPLARYGGGKAVCMLIHVEFVYAWPAFVRVCGCVESCDGVDCDKVKASGAAVLPHTCG